MLLPPLAPRARALALLCCLAASPAPRPTPDPVALSAPPPDRPSGRSHVRASARPLVRPSARPHVRRQASVATGPSCGVRRPSLVVSSSLPLLCARPSFGLRTSFRTPRSCMSRCLRLFARRCVCSTARSAGVRRLYFPRVLFWSENLFQDTPEFHV